MIPSELLNLLQPNLVWWCIIMSQIVFQTDWYAVFKIKITVKDHIINLWLSELLIFLQLNLVWWHIITILWKDKIERVTGLGRRTRKEIAKWNQMTALRFPDRGETSDIPSLPSGVFTEQSRSWWCAIKPSLVAKGSAVKKIY